MKVSIIGLGWFGEELGLELVKKGHAVVGTTRSSEKMAELNSKGLKALRFVPPMIPEALLLDCDAVVLNIPPGPDHLEWYRTWNWKESQWIVFISSTSLIPKPETDSARIIFQEEQWVKQRGPFTILRFGGLFGKDRHPGKSLSGKKDLRGKDWPVNLLHLDDAVGFTLAVLEKRIQNKTFSVVSDFHPKREEFYTRYAVVNNLARPEFDQNDTSPGKLVSNEESKKFYEYKNTGFN
jgi:nucleoside-diphosphate-sugar epimerase